MRADFSITNNLLEALEETKSTQSRAISEISSGRRVSKPSDDPSASGALVLNATAQAAVDGYTAGDAGLRSRFAYADNALSNAVQQMTRAITLGVQGSSGSNSTSDRAAIAGELTGIRKQMLSLANSTFQGKYLFSGEKDNTPAFAADLNDVIHYGGASTTASVVIDHGISTPAGITGDKLFGSDGSNVFDALSAVITALNGGGSVSGAAAALQTSLTNLTSQRVFYGNAMNAIDGATQSIAWEKQQLSQTADQLGGADISQAITELTQAETAQGAVSAAFAKVSQMSLLNYLNSSSG